MNIPQKSPSPAQPLARTVAPPKGARKKPLVYPQLNAKDIVGVQPMDGPAGLAFYFDIVYGGPLPTCECGSAKTNQTHASYCPLGGKK